MSHAQAQSSLGPFLSSTGSIPRTTEPIPYGTILGKDRYVVRDILGSGGYSTVYRAHDKQCGREVALKVSRIGGCSNSVAARILSHERRVYERIEQHPNIVNVYDIEFLEFLGHTVRALSMEVVAGGTLRQWLVAFRTRHDIRVRDGIQLMVQACRGLSAMHRAGVAHLDVKPENFLITRDGRLKVSDFGAAKELLHAPPLDSVSRSLSLRHGTPEYTSPDQWLAGPMEASSMAWDVYSLGIVMYELFSTECRPPFAGSMEELCQQHVFRKPQPLRSGNSRLDAIVMRCLEKVVSRRATLQSLTHDTTILHLGEREQQRRTHGYEWPNARGRERRQ